MKQLLSGFLVIIVTNALFSIRYPIEPESPKDPEKTGASEAISKSNKSVKRENQNIEVYVEAELGSGDSITGSISIPPKISFEHYYNGILYKKNARLSEIKSIVVKNYKKYLGKDQKKYKSYKFYPDLIEINFKSGHTFTVKGMFKFLQKFVIETGYGSTTLYTYFGDMFSPETGWSEVLSKDPQYHRQNPHPQAVKKLVFKKIIFKDNSDAETEYDENPEINVNVTVEKADGKKIKKTVSSKTNPPLKK